MSFSPPSIPPLSAEQDFFIAKLKVSARVFSKEKLIESICTESKLYYVAKNYIENKETPITLDQEIELIRTQKAYIHADKRDLINWLVFRTAQRCLFQNMVEVKQKLKEQENVTQSTF